MAACHRNSHTSPSSPCRPAGAPRGQRSHSYSSGIAANIKSFKIDKIKSDGVRLVLIGLKIEVIFASDQPNNFIYYYFESLK